MFMFEGFRYNQRKKKHEAKKKNERNRTVALSYMKNKGFFKKTA